MLWEIHLYKDCVFLIYLSTKKIYYISTYIDGIKANRTGLKNTKHRYTHPKSTVHTLDMNNPATIINLAPIWTI